MSSLFRDHPTAEDNDRVGIANGAETVGDGDDGPSLHEALQCFDHESLGFRVESSSGLVEDENRRVANDGAGNSDALTLAPGKSKPSLADHRVVTVRHSGNEFVRVREFRRFLDFLLSGAGPAISNVVAYRSPEQHSVLQHETNLVAERMELVLANVNTVNTHAAGSGVIKAWNQAHDCG